MFTRRSSHFIFRSVYSLVTSSNKTTSFGYVDYDSIWAMGNHRKDRLEMRLQIFPSFKMEARNVHRIIVRITC